MFKIGEFSRLAQVPIKTLRYYDEVGLLRPAQVDPFTDYRYYSADQLARLNRILAFKDLSFSLDEIARLLDENIPPDQMRGMLRLKQAEIREQVEREQERLGRVEARLHLIEQESKMSDYDIVIKQVPARRVISLRTSAPSYDLQDALWQELYAFLAPQSVKLLQPSFTLYHDENYREAGPDIEICQPFEGTFRENERIRLREIPAVPQMASVVHHGSFETLSAGYHALTRWIEHNGFQIAGPGRDVYLHLTQPVRLDDPAYVTEIQFPIERA